MTEKLRDHIDNEWKIREILNNEFSDDITDDEITVGGILFTHHEDVDREEVTERLHSENLTFERTGSIVRSYDRWVDTLFTDWE